MESNRKEMDKTEKELIYKHLEKFYETFQDDYLTIRSNKTIKNHPEAFFRTAFGIELDFNMFHEWALSKSRNNEYEFIEYPPMWYRRYNIKGEIIFQSKFPKT